MSIRNLSAKQPAKNIAAAPPTKKVMNPDGVVTTMKVSPLWGTKMVSPDGDVVHVTLSTGYTIRGFRNNPHAQQKLDEKLKAGFLPFAECPVATRRIPGEPCTGQFSEEKCCPHMDSVIAERRKAYGATQTDYLKNFATQTDKLLEFVKSRAVESAVADRQEKKGRIPGG